LNAKDYRISKRADLCDRIFVEYPAAPHGHLPASIPCFRITF
jgi:hypothetical protein